MARPGTGSADDGSESVSPSSGPRRGELRCTTARNRHVSQAVALFAAAALAVSLSACSSTAQASKAGTFYGSELALGNGKVKTYVVTGTLTAVSGLYGLALPAFIVGFIVSLVLIFKPHLAKAPLVPMAGLSAVGQLVQ